MCLPSWCITNTSGKGKAAGFKKKKKKREKLTKDDDFIRAKKKQTKEEQVSFLEEVVLISGKDGTFLFITRY